MYYVGQPSFIMIYVLQYNFVNAFLFCETFTQDEDGYSTEIPKPSGTQYWSQLR